MKKQMTSRQRQSGAVLYIALIILILLALIGIVAMQVAGLQERMSSNYQAGSMAFQNAEAGARGRETDLKGEVIAGIVPATNIPPRDCMQPFNAEAYEGAQAHVRRLDLCFSWGALDVPSDESEKTDQIYQVTSYNTDRRSLLPAFKSAESVVDTVFIP